MTPEIDRIRDQFRRSLEGNAWHGPALNDLLSGVTAAMASAKPVADAHSIREIVLHIAAWQRAAVRMLRGESVDLNEQEDWPAPFGSDNESWRHAVDQLRATHSELDSAIAALDDARLSDPIAARDYNVYFLLHGIIQHGLYHGGQIALLKKGLTPGPLPQ
jgi:uncharacterized damage-inducible protein DinB